MKRAITLIILFLWPAISAWPQSQCSFQPVKVGESGAIRVVFDISGIKPESIITISGNLSFANPTVFYPDSLQIENINPDSVTSEIKSSNEYDYIYGFTARFPANLLTGDKIGVQFIGKALAGYSRQTDADFKDILINGENIPNFSCAVALNDSSLFPLYFRLPFVEYPRPNPVPSTGATWDFYLDSASNVHIKVYNSLGQEFLYSDLGFLQPGHHEFRMEPSYTLPSGCYRLKLVSNLGVVIKSFVVAK